MSSSNILTFVKLFVLSIVSGWTSALSSFGWSAMPAAMPAGEGYFMLHSSSGLFAALSGYASPVTILCIYGTLSFSFGLIRPFYALELFIGSHCHSVAVYVSFCIYLSATALACICYCILLSILAHCKTFQSWLYLSPHLFLCSMLLPRSMGGAAYYAACAPILSVILFSMVFSHIRTIRFVAVRVYINFSW